MDYLKSNTWPTLFFNFFFQTTTLYSQVYPLDKTILNKVISTDDGWRTHILCRVKIAFNPSAQKHWDKVT